MLRSEAIAVVLLSFSLLAVRLQTNAQDAVTYRVVALTGEQAPGVEAGVTYQEFLSFPGVIKLNDAGHIGYIARLVGPGVDSFNEIAIFGPGNGSELTAVIRENAQMPGLDPGNLFGQFVFYEPFRLNNAGQISIFYGISLLGTAILAPRDGLELVPIAVVDDPVPSLGANVYYRDFWHYNLNDSGQSAFYATLSGLGATSQYNTVILSNVDGFGMTPIAQSDWHAPGLPSDVLYLYVTDPLLNDRGQIAYFTRLAENGDTNSTDDAFYKYNNRTGSDYFLLARNDNQIPGYETGVTYWSITRDTLRMNNAGQVVFSSAMRGNGIVAPNNRALFMTTDGSDVTTLLRYGDDAPGLGGEVRFKNVGLGSILLNDQGHIAFQGYITGVDVTDDNDNVLFGPLGDTPLSAIARERDPVPGYHDGAQFKKFFTIQLNDAGQVAFLAELTGTGIDGTNNYALFATDSDGNLLLVAAQSDTINVSRDPQVEDLRTIAMVRDYIPTNIWGNFALNNSGEIALQVTFTDGTSGILVAMIPQPACSADVNGDGTLSPADFTAWIAAFDSQAQGCDQNGDSSCTPADFTAWIANYNAGCN